ncbi:thiolase C-terminal domain-containing protein [Catenovulum sp. SX2]|uniref:thiolase C-terminal domain-containing protein n=1 Tax=Catenovulum sp. SX2 TaxID=3398614 RepID=UPI003F870C28
MSCDVYILGVGMTPVSKNGELCVGQMGAQALRLATDSIGLDLNEIGALYAGNMMAGQLCHQQLVATAVANQAGIAGVEAITAEGACASGAAAARLGYLAIASGCHSTVAVCGVEKMTHRDRELVVKTLATASHRESESSQGATFLSLNAQIMRQYMSTYNIDSANFAGFSVNAHKNALTNPVAMLRKPVSNDDYVQSRVLDGPLRLLDAPPICDGASAIILGNSQMAKYYQKLGLPVVRILASTVASDQLAIAHRKEPTRLVAAELSIEKAYAWARVQPSDISIFEPHDAYTVMTALSLEAAGFAAKGEGTAFAQENMINLNGDLPICTFGGLKARGHPVGATGLYQISECFLQLTGQAGDNQARHSGIAMTQNFSGAASVAFTNILAAC